MLAPSLGLANRSLELRNNVEESPENSKARKKEHDRARKAVARAKERCYLIADTAKALQQSRRPSLNRRLQLCDPVALIWEEG